jgi:uncharacterized membrane protein
MKGETPMSLQDLAVTMALFVVAVLILLAIATIAFVKWDKREKQRRTRQIERARLDAKSGNEGPSG